MFYHVLPYLWRFDLQTRLDLRSSRSEVALKLSMLSQAIARNVLDGTGTRLFGVCVRQVCVLHFCLVMQTVNNGNHRFCVCFLGDILVALLECLLEIL